MGFQGPAAEATHIAVSMGGPWIIEATWPKSRVADLREKYLDRDMAWLYYDNEQFRKRLRYKFALWCATRCNLPYGVGQLLGFYFSSLWPWAKENPLASGKTPVCSYLPAWALRRIGFDAWPGTPTGNIVPAHYLSSSKFQVVDVSGQE